MTQKQKSAALALGSMAAGIACMPVAAFVSTVAGMGLATASVYMAYAAG